MTPNEYRKLDDFQNDAKTIGDISLLLDLKLREFQEKYPLDDFRYWVVTASGKLIAVSSVQDYED